MSETESVATGDVKELPLPGDEAVTESDKGEKINEESAESSQKTDLNSSDSENSDNEELALPESDEDERKTWPKGYADRLKREKVKLAEERARTAELAAQLQASARQVPEYVAPRSQSLEAPPERDDFESDYEYQSAVVDAVMRNKMAALQVDQQRASMEKHETDFRKKWTEVQENGPEKYGDFDEKVSRLNSNDFPPNRAMCEAILDSKHSTDILYFLGMYPDKAKEIALLNPVQAVRRVTEIEHRFVARKKGTAVKVIDALGSSGTGGKGGKHTGSKAPDNMTEFREWYKAKTGRAK